MPDMTESEIELFSLEMLKKLGFSYTPASDFISENDRDEISIKKKSTSGHPAVLQQTLEDAIHRLNPYLAPSLRHEALKTVLSLSPTPLMTANETFHSLLCKGVHVTLQKDGQERGEQVWLIDFQKPENNDFSVVNQFTVYEDNQQKRPDVIIFINGLPLIVMELKNPAQEHATVRKAYDQIQTYKNVIPSLFIYNAFCIISDGLEAKAGTLSSPYSRFQAWKSVDGQKVAAATQSQLETLIPGMLNRNTLLDLIRNFIIFEDEKKIDSATGLITSETVKKIAAYHQFYAVNKAVACTRKAVSVNGDRKAGVVWHTQGSGKSLTMVFYAGKLIQQLDNPTIVVITDRNDLDQQLFETFAASSALLNQTPVQATSRQKLKELLRVASGGVVFTTIQKFFPDNETDLQNASMDQLSERSNIIIIADEAHRTQYGFKAKEKKLRISYGFAKYLRDALPNATFIGFTGTPVESTDINTPAVFGNYIDIYDIAQSVADGSTVKIYYESRLAQMNVTEEGRTLLAAFDQEMSDDEDDDSQQAKARWTRLEAIVGHPSRLKNLARDIVNHFETRHQAISGKAMIVTMSRRIAVALYDEIIRLRPQWHSEDLNAGVLKVVMTSSSSDKMEFDPEDPDSIVIPSYHRTGKEERRKLANRMKNPLDSLQLVIVRDMWLTGFDVPCLHTMYIDKLMKKHTLMQAIARVNRVYLDKPGGLIVDYIGIGNALKEALSFYTNSGGKGDPAETMEKALQLLLEKMEVVRQMFDKFDYKVFFTAGTAQRLTIILQAHEWILAQNNGKERFIKEATVLFRLFALAVPHESALALRDEIVFFQILRARFFKFAEDDNDLESRLNASAIRQLVNQAVESNDVVDIFSAAGMDKPEISLLSEEFLADVRAMKHPHLALELLRKILNDEIKQRLNFNITQRKSLLDMLEVALNRYRNNLVTTAEVIEELLTIARDLRTVEGLAEKLHLTEEEFAFYSALEMNDSAVKQMGTDVLSKLAREIADRVRSNATIDWTRKESARARLMVMVARVLRRNGYPPDKQQKAVDTVLAQAERLAGYWVEG